MLGSRFGNAGLDHSVYYEFFQGSERWLVGRRLVTGQFLVLSAHSRQEDAAAVTAGLNDCLLRQMADGKQLKPELWMRPVAH